MSSIVAHDWYLPIWNSRSFLILFIAEYWQLNAFCYNFYSFLTCNRSLCYIYKVAHEYPVLDRCSGSNDLELDFRWVCTVSFAIIIESITSIGSRVTNFSRGWYDVTNTSQGVAETAQGVWHRIRRDRDYKNQEWPRVRDRKISVEGDMLWHNPNRDIGCQSISPETDIFRYGTRGNGIGSLVWRCLYMIKLTWTDINYIRLSPYFFLANLFLKQGIS